MMKGLNGDMLDAIKRGESPICVIDKRLASGKKQTYQLAKKFGLLPKGATEEEFMKDTNDFWTTEVGENLGNNSSGTAA